ncbi:MAG TPA: quinone oxidoreductase [Polyangia bacterium]|jgi:NADPH2:quinone reductase|nr:quinone oxidoreductase [Polyangia bacterium]
MAKAIVVHETGGPEVLSWEEVPDPPLGPGQARVRHTAIGVNYVDVYFRTGLYKAPALPFVSGQEAAGVVEAVAPDVTEIKVGDRVAYAFIAGACAEVRNVAAARLVPLPDDIDDRTAAAAMLKGMSAQYLLLRCGRVKRGDTILFHAAAGGVGLIASQWAKHLGVRVIGTVSTAEKARLAFEHGCEHVVNYVKESFVHRVHEITHGEGVAVAFDSVGKTTFRATLDCIRARGLMVAFGQSSGPIPPFDITLLSIKGSLYLTRPTLASYIGTRPELLETANDLFDVVRSGVVKIHISRTLRLSEVAEAHRELEARHTTGSVVLVP